MGVLACKETAKAQIAVFFSFVARGIARFWKTPSNTSHYNYNWLLGLKFAVQEHVCCTMNEHSKPQFTLTTNYSVQVYRFFSFGDSKAAQVGEKDTNTTKCSVLQQKQYSEAETHQTTTVAASLPDCVIWSKLLLAMSNNLLLPFFHTLTNFFHNRRFHLSLSKGNSRCLPLQLTSKISLTF